MATLVQDAQAATPSAKAATAEMAETPRAAVAVSWRMRDFAELECPRPLTRMQWLTAWLIDYNRA